MNARINSHEDQKIDVTFTFEDGSKLEKVFDLQPVGYDKEVEDEDGKVTKVLAFQDPLEDIETWLKGYAQAYQNGKSVVEEKGESLAGRTFTFTLDAVAAPAEPNVSER